MTQMESEHVCLVRPLISQAVSSNLITEDAETYQELEYLLHECWQDCEELFQRFIPVPYHPYNDIVMLCFTCCQNVYQGRHDIFQGRIRLGLESCKILCRSIYRTLKHDVTETSFEDYLGRITNRSALQMDQDRISDFYIFTTNALIEYFCSEYPDKALQACWGLVTIIYDIGQAIQSRAIGAVGFPYSRLSEAVLALRGWRKAYEPTLDLVLDTVQGSFKRA